MVKLSLVDIEICLALFISNTKIGLYVYHQLVALHEDEQGVLEVRNQVVPIVFENVDINEFVGNDLGLVDSLNVVHEPLYIERVVFSPLEELFGCLQTLIQKNFLLKRKLEDYNSQQV